MIILGEKKYHPDLMRTLPLINDFGWMDRPIDNNELGKAVDKAISGSGQKQSSTKPRIERRKEQEPRTIPSQYHPKSQQPPQQPQQYQSQQHTSVRVNQRPGGNSNIVFGTDDSNYNHYRK